MSTRQVASSTLWQVASQIVMAALSIVMIKLTVTGLSKELFGMYNTAYGYLQIFGILADFGLYAVSVREVSRVADKPEREKVLGALTVLRAIIMTISLGAALVIAWVIPQWHGTPLPLGITIAAFVPGLTLLAGVLRTVFQVAYKMHFVFIAEVTQRVVTVGLTAALVLGGLNQSQEVSSYYLLLGVGGVGAFVLFVLSVFFASRLMDIRPRFDRALLKSIFLHAAPYGLAFLCTTLYRQFDVTLISLLRPADYQLQNADYGAVQRMMDMAYLFPTFLLNSTLPILVARHAEGRDTRDFLGNVLFAVALLGTTAFLFSIFWARPLMELLTREEYLSTATEAGADTALQILSISMLMNGVIVYAFYVLLTRHAWRPLVATLSVGVVLSLALNLWLIPELGFVGAASTSAVTHTVRAALRLPQARRQLPARLNLTHLRQWALYAGGLTAFLFTARPFLTHQLITAAFLAGGGVWILGLGWGAGLHRTLRVAE